MFEMSKSKTILLNVYKYLNIQNLHQKSKQSIFNGCTGEEKWAVHARGRFKNETFQASTACGTASYFDNLNLILLKYIKHYFLKKKPHPQVKKLAICLQSTIFKYIKFISKKEHMWLVSLQNSPDFHLGGLTFSRDA